MPSDNEAKNQALAQELNANLLNATPIIPPNAPQTPLSAVLADDNASWAFSETGGTGAMLVKSDVESSGGTALKVENPAVAKQVTKSAQMMDSFFQNAQGPAPFVAPRITTYNTSDLQNDPALATQLKDKLQDLHDNGPETSKRRVNNQIKRLNEVDEGNGSVVKMEFASGKMINKLDAPDRVALYKSDAFPQAIGKSMPTLVAMGMKDHLGVEGTGFANNAANLMFDKDQGQLTAIDFDTGMTSNPIDRDDNDLLTFGKSGATQSMDKLDTFLQDALKDQQSFDAAVEKMANGQQTPLKGMMDSFTKADWSDNMFVPEDAAMVAAEISMEDKRRFAANLLSGTVDGLDYLKSNQAALRTAAESTYETVKGVELQHFHTPQQLDELCQQLDQIDTNQLRQNMDQRLSGMEVARKQQAKADLSTLETDIEQLQQQANHLEAKIAHLETSPNLKDKINATFRHGGMKDYIQEQKALLANTKGELDNKIQEAKSIINKEGFYDSMKQKAADVKAQQKAEAVEAKVQKIMTPEKPAVNKLKDNPAFSEAAAKLESKTKQDLGIKDAPVVGKLRDNPAFSEAAAKLESKTKQDLGIKDAPAVGKLRDNPELAAAAKSLQGKLSPEIEDNMSEGVKTPKTNISSKR